MSAVPSGPSIDIWRSRKFLGTVLRALQVMPGGLERFLPCRIGAHHCGLRSSGREQCGDGLTSRPFEASHVGVLDDLLSIFGYPTCSGDALLAGSLKMRHCTKTFPDKKPILPAGSHVGGLLTAGGPDVGLVGVPPLDRVDLSDTGF